jgi:catechol 2,3-dioxygenase-like lactoylglutathione lyase family enzyme
MLSGLRWLALETWYLDRARECYEAHLGLTPEYVAESEVAYDVGGTDLVLREPGPVPRGGVHVHYALATPPDRYDDWWDRLETSFDLDQVTFGDARSLYFYDPDDHCVEIGEREPTAEARNDEQRGRERGGSDEPLDGIFEIVFEVEALDRAEAFYRDLGFHVVDRGDGRDRVRLGGPVALELWEPQRGLADARGGVHADIGFTTDDPDAAVERVADRACAVETVDVGRRIRDPDGHYVTFVE